MAMSPVESPMAAPARPEDPVSYEAFLERLDEDQWAEWVEGRIVTLSPASEAHQELKGFLVTLLRRFVRRRGLGRVLDAPFQVKLGPELPGREPDILFVRTERVHLFRGRYFDGAPDAVLEIVSPDSRVRDRGEKFYEYEAAGVREYWLVDPDRQQAEFYRLDERGRYRMVVPDSQGVFRSEAVPGFWLCIEWLWQDPLPDEGEILARLLAPDAGTGTE